MASSSAAAATKKQPPGKMARSRYVKKASHRERTRRRPAGAAMPGCVTSRSKHLGGGIDGRHLQVLFRPKVREQAALTHSRVLRESGDREPVEALDGGELGRGVQDGLTAPSPIRPLPASIGFRVRRALGRHANNIARPVVL